MNAIQSIFRQHAEAYCQTHATTLQQRKVIAAICHCRSAELGTIQYRCPDCPHLHTTHMSCGNRHCPTCDGGKAARWLNRQLSKQLPCGYFLLTFTLPEELRSLALGRSKEVYTAMMQATAHAMRTLAANPRHVGADCLGFTAVLHTWGRQLQFHPHVHVVVPAGGLNSDASLWMRSRAAFFAPVRALSNVYRDSVISQLDAVGLGDQIPDTARTGPWVVHCQAAGSGENTLKYLARYVFRVAITPERVVAVTDTHVTIQYTKVGSNRPRFLKLSVFEFIRRYLMHVLPKGFMKVRHYGFLHPNAAVDFDEVRALVAEENDVIVESVDLPEETDLLADGQPLRCPRCNVPLIVTRFLPIRSIAKLAHGLPMKVG